MKKWFLYFTLTFLTFTVRADVESVSDIVPFDLRSRWEHGKELKVEQSAQGTETEFTKAPKYGEKVKIAKLSEVSFPLKDIGKPFAIECEVELLKGKDVTIAMILQDRNGECFALREIAPKTGKNKISWKIPADIAGSWGENKDGKPDAPLSIVQFNIAQYPTDAPAQLRFKSLKKHENVRDVDAIAFRYQTNSRLPILKAGDEDKFGIVLTNNAVRPVAFKAHLTLRHSGGEERVFERSFQLPAGGSVEWKPKWNSSNKFGIWRADWKIVSADQKRTARNTRTSFAYLRPAGPSPETNPEFDLGFNLRQQHWSLEDRETESEAAALAGAKILRTGCTWEGIERADGVFDFTEADALIALNAKNHMRQMFLIAYTPSFAAKPELLKTNDWNDWNKSVPDAAKLERFVRRLAAHYKGKITFYEFWNEPDLSFWRGNINEYLDRMKIVYRALKESDPQAQLISGGIAGDHAAAKPGFHETMVREGQKDFDFHGFHQHGDYKEYRRVLDTKVAEIRKQLKPSKPLYFTETGFYVSSGNYLAQAENVFRKIIYARVAGARGYIWFDLRDDGFLPGYCEHNYGLLTHDWFPKEGYAVYNTLNALLGKAFFAGTLLDNERSSIYAFKRGGDRILALWRTDSRGVGDSIVLNTDAKQVTYIDWMGNAEKLSLQNGRVNFTIPARPGFLVFSECKKEVTLGKTILSPQNGNVVAVPGKSLNLAFKVYNPGKKTEKLSIKWIGTASGVSAKNIERNVPAGESGIVLPLQLSDSVREPLRLDLEYSLGAARGRLSLPVNLAKQIPSGAFPATPQFSLKNRDSMVSMMEHNPFTAHRVWTGPEDQSAELFLAVEKGQLKIRIHVTDDVLIRSKTAAGCFMEDGVQLALAVPGQPGHWEFGFAVLEKDRPGSHTWITPSGWKAPKIGLSVKIVPDGVVYDASLPLKELGITPEKLRNGIRFNVLVNENDGDGRDGWIQIAPGIGEAKNPDAYPFVTGN